MVHAAAKNLIAARKSLALALSASAAARRSDHSFQVSARCTSQRGFGSRFRSASTVPATLRHCSNVARARLLDDNPCAAPQVTRADDAFTAAVVHDDVPFVLAYRHDVPAAPGYWYLYAAGGGASVFPAGAGSNIAIPGAQAQACRDDRIFGNDFEN
jgi:hypothetical protein